MFKWLKGMRRLPKPEVLVSEELAMSELELLKIRTRLEYHQAMESMLEARIARLRRLAAEREPTIA